MAGKSKGTKRTAKKRSKPDWAPRFLVKLAATANIRAACKAASIGKTAVYKRRDSDPEFAQAMAEALDDACDDLELEARRRAKDGTQKPVYFKGEQCGVIHEYSDTLMIFLLKAHRPEKFRERVKVEHGGEGGGPIPHKHEHAIPTAERLAPYADAFRDLFAEFGRVRSDGSTESLGGSEAARESTNPPGPIPDPP